MTRKPWILAALAAVAIAAVYRSPLLEAERYKSRIQTAIETSLNRKVDISGGLRFSLLSGFGFSIANVAIHEDPSIGIEPFAYVESLEARIRPASLLRGRWEVSRITLDTPTVNLVKHSSGVWNVRPLLSRTAGVQSLPEIQVRGGRINFKFGDTKSIVYCINSDVDITPGPEIGIRFSVEPARTDRLAQGFGILSGRGKLQWETGRPGKLDLNLDLERAALSDLALLLEGHGAGLNGFLGSRARIHGSLDALRIEGRARFDGVQRYTLLNFGGGDWPILYDGVLRFPDGDLDVETRSDADPAPVRLRLRAHHLLEHPAWGAILQFREQPFAPLKGVLQYLSVELPGRVSLDGKLNGVLGYSPGHGLQGYVEMPEAAVKTASATAKLTAASVIVDRTALRLRPAQVDLGNGQIVEIQGTYGNGGHSFTWNTAGQPLAVDLLLGSQRELSGATDIPLLTAMSQGEWNGTLRYEQSGDAPPAWSGNFTLRNARLTVTGLAEPVVLRSAAATIRDNRVTLDGATGSSGGIAFRASYREAPQRLRIQADEADLARLEALFAPALNRRAGFLARTLSRPAVAPDWLRARRLEASVEIRSILHGAATLGSVSGRLIWNGTQVTIGNLKWNRGEASGTGELALRLTAPDPVYQLTGDMKGLSFRGGKVDGEGVIESWGSGAALVHNAKAVGRFSAHGVDVADSAFGAATGAFEFAADRLRLSGLEASMGPETFTGQGRSESDGRLLVDLASSQRRLRIGGTLWPFDLEAKP